MQGFPVIRTRKIRILLNLGATIVWLKVILEIKHSLILLLTERLSPTLEWREPFECASASDRLIDVKLLDC